MPKPIGCNKQGAIEYLGCSASMFDDLSAEHKIKRVRRDWFSYADLDETMLLLRKERDQDEGAIENETAKGVTEKRRRVGSQGARSYNGQTEKLLRIER